MAGKAVSMLRLLLMLSFVLLVAGGAFAQAVPVVTSAVPLPVPVDASPRLYPSPDGTLVAYQRAVQLADHTEYSLCLLATTAGSAPVCTLIAQPPPRGFEPDPQAVDLALAWSPDGQQIAVTGQPLLGQEDTDLLVYNRALDQWRNLSGDAYAGALNEQSRLERHPTWSPDSATLAVVQTPAASDPETTSSIALFDLESGARSLLPLPAAIADALGRPAMTLIDARAGARFRGETEPLDPVAGHIPGALNRPFGDNMAPDGRFKPAAELRAEFERLLAGRDPATVVHHCGSGVSAVPNLLAMEIAGLHGARLHAGSWSEWCADPGRPVAR